MVIGTRVRHRTINRLGTILGTHWIGERLVNDIEAGPYKSFYCVQWDDGTVENGVSEKELVQSEGIFHPGARVLRRVTDCLGRILEMRCVGRFADTRYYYDVRWDDGYVSKNGPEGFLVKHEQT